MVKLWCLSRSNCISHVETNCYGENVKRKSCNKSKSKSGRDRLQAQHCTTPSNTSEYDCEDTFMDSFTPVALSSSSLSSSHTAVSPIGMFERYKDEEEIEEIGDTSYSSGGVDYVDHGYETHVPDRRRRYSFGRRGSNKCGIQRLHRRRSSQHDSISNNYDQWNVHHDELEEDLRYGYTGGSDRSNIYFGTVLGNSSIRRSTPRRSSLKNKSTPRRASIGYTGEMTLILPTGEEKKRRSSITFADETENQTKEVQPVQDMVDGNINRLWFQEEEYDHIKKEIVRIVRQSSKRNLLAEDVTSREPETWVCTRGLESFDIDRRSFRNSVRQEAKNGVIEEYALQKANGRFDEEAIRQMYTFHTIDCKIEAAERGAQDALFVQNYLNAPQNGKQFNRRRSC